MQIVLDGRIKTDAAVLALGMFDGVHIGHQVLLQKAKALKDVANAPLVACTFMNHPLALVAPEKCPPMLTTFDERAALLEEQGVDILYAMPFDEKVRDMLPEEYVGELVRRFHPCDVVCGYNHTFGAKGGGSPALLGVLGGALGFRTSVVPKITLDGAEVSSSEIRRLLISGDVAAARQRLGRPYQRNAVLAKREGGLCEWVMPPNGKQDVGVGSYRVMWTEEGRTTPTTLRVTREGRCEGRVPEAVEIGQQGQIHFITKA